MKFFLKQIIQLVLLLVTTPLYAETDHLFPSDIIDQAEQATYDTKRADRYENQRVWTYPEKPYSGRSGQSESMQSNYPGDYAIDKQPLSYQTQPNYESNRSVESERYRNSANNPNRFWDSKPLDTIPERYPSSFHRGSQSAQFPKTTGRQNYPGEEYINRFGKGMSEQVMKMEPMNNSMNSGGEYGQKYPNLLYPSDLKPESSSSGLKNETMRFQAQEPFEQARSKDQIRYVPVPVYGAPRTLPGTIPGVITPGSMVPGYSHLSPNYNYGGLNNVLGSPYYPPMGFSPFSGMGNPFGNVYNNSWNNPQHGWPLTTPHFMGPGFNTPYPNH